MATGWRAGDSRAGIELFDRYYELLERFFANKVHGDSSDLIQDTFASCVSSREKIAQGKFRGFLFGIAYNKLRQFYERARLDGARFDYDAVSSADLSPGPTTMLAKSAEQRLLLEALRRIPVQHQVALEMFYWEDMTSAEIAEALGEPHGTVRTRIRRARLLLEEALAQVSTDAATLEQTRTKLDDWASEVRAANVHGPRGVSH